MNNPTQSNPGLSIIIQSEQERTDTLRLSQDFNKKWSNCSKISIDITNFSIMKDDIKNYRELTVIQLIQVETLTDIEKIELIKIYNIMLNSIKDLI